jgi:hypothetical protein
MSYDKGKHFEWDPLRILIAFALLRLHQGLKFEGEIFGDSNELHDF